MKRLALAIALLCFSFSLFGDIATNQNEFQAAIEEANETLGAVAPFILLNYFPGLGLGSFIQGDNLNGILCLSSEIVGYAIIAWAYSYGSGANLQFSWKSFNDWMSLLGIITLGSAFLTASIVFDNMGPMGFYRKAKESGQGPRISLSPSIVNPMGEASFGLSLRVVF